MKTQPQLKGHKKFISTTNIIFASSEDNTCLSVVEVSSSDIIYDLYECFLIYILKGI